MTGRMEGRVTLVTGASSGIGRATAELLAREGADVALVALPGDELEQAAEACRAAGVSAVAVPADVGDSSSVAMAFARAAELGEVDAVFNNAGISIVGPVQQTSDEQWERQLRTNLTGSFFVARQAATVMAPRRRGAIVNTASELALLGQAGYVAYTATKGGVLAMTRALAAELAHQGLRVNAVCPGPVDTPLLHAEFEVSDNPQAEGEEMEQSIALGRMAQPVEVARVVLSDDAEYVTGAHYTVDAGRTSCIPGGRAFREPSAPVERG